MAFLTLGLVQQGLALGSRPNTDPNAPPPPAWASWVPLVVMIFIFYFLLIRPQSKQRRERQNMLGNLKKGDKIITQGGMYATILKTEPNYLEVKISEETKVKLQKSAVSEVLIEKPKSAAEPTASKN